VGVGIGLALQGGAANFAGGILILFLKPFRVGDFILEVNENNQGTVKAIGMFYTTLIGKGDRKIIIPNAKLTDASVINMTASGYWLCDIAIGISYDDDIDKARGIMLREAEKYPRVLKDKEIRVLLAELAESSVKLELRCWTEIDDHWDALWDLTENIKKAFDAEDITIAFNQLDVHLDSAK
jgi:small conductance mechanosensitive channel